ncbi:unnamed protein product [Malus baccata var. baccata]
MLDASAGGALVDKTPMAAKTLIANRALNAQQYEGVGQRDTPRQQVNEVSSTSDIQSQLANLTSIVSQMAEGMKMKEPSGQENQAKAMQNQDKRVDQMEKQIRQIAEFMGQFREQGKLPSSTVVNLKGGFESAKAMSLRSGKQVGSDPQPSKSRSNEVEELIIEENEQSTPTERVETPLPQALNAPKPSNSANKGKEVPILINSNVVPPNVPFPRRFMQSKKEEAEKDILETFRKVQVNIPLLDAIKQVPKYAKFLKELCTTKRRMSNKEVVKVSENVSAVLQHKLPTKCKDPGSFTIPCVIGNTRFENAMLDLGASINVMPYSIYASMNLGELKKDGMIIQLVDRSNAYPKGVLEDVLVQTWKIKSIPPRCRFSLEYLEELNEDALEIAITKGIKFKTRELGAMQTHGQIWDPNAVPFNEEVVEVVAALESLPRQYFKLPLSISSLVSTKKLPFIVQVPTLELKPLPDHLKYVFLGDDETLSVIVSSSLTAHEEEKLVRVLREHKIAIGWTLADIRGISPTTCMHCILLEEGTKPSREAQHRLNPPMMEVVKNDIIKLLDCGVIHPISDSHWVSPVQVVPKKSGVIFVKNDENELVPTRIQTGWRVCIDYRKLNATTRKDHFPLPFIDQMLERRFIKDFSKMSNPFCRLLQKDVPFQFDEECESAFKQLKEKLTSTPIIVPPDWTLPFELMCDASDYALGAVLGQRKDKQPHVIYYASRTLNDAQLNYSTTKKELLAVVFALYTMPLGLSVIVYTDHAALKYLLTKKEAKPRLIRWMLLLQEFDIKI